MFAQESLMDIQKEKIAHEKHLFSQGVDFKYLPNIQYSELENVYELIEWDEEYSEALNEINSSWCTWQAAKAQAVPEWISVKDKLPGFNQSVLCCDGFETCVAEYLESCKNDYGVFFEEGFWINGAASIFENVTHWMPLPEVIEAQEQAHD